ncbi:MAG: protein kinase [Planctomycetes bacterium]|nr:protein kinase [Planctomycetota bacterium]
MDAAVIARCETCGAKYRILDPGGKTDIPCKKPGCGGRVRIPRETLRMADKTLTMAPPDAAGALPPGIPVEEMPEELREAARDAKKRFGKYVLLEEIGRGGAGVVHRAWDATLCREVALKFLTSMGDEDDVERFLREARTAASLAHPNIAQVYEIGEEDGKHYVAMQLIDGHDLADRRYPAKRALAILRDAAGAVEFAHSHGIIHRDLKPRNILLDSHGTPYVLDFGLAKPLRTQSRLTRTGAIMGTPAYMSPEQASGDSRRIGKRSDVYALGATLYEMLTGRPPFRGETPIVVLAAVTTKEPVPPRLLFKEIPPEAETICLKALEKDPARRYASARALAQDCDRFVRGVPIEAKPASVLARVWRRVRRHRPALVATAVVLAAGVSMALWFSHREKKLRDEMADRAPSGPGPVGSDAAVAARGEPPPEAKAAFDAGFARLDDARNDLYRPGANLDSMRARLREAVGKFDEAIRLWPADETFWFHRGRAKVLLQDLGGAADDFGQAIERRPRYVPARIERGKVFLRIHRREEERRGWRWDPAPSDAGQERLDAALADFLVAAEGGEGLELDMGKAYHAFAGRDWDRCLEILDRLLARENPGEELHFMRGSAYYWSSLAEFRGQPEERSRYVRLAQEDFQAAVEKRANYDEALAMLGACLAETGGMQGTDEIFYRALALNPSDPFVREVLGTRALHWARRERGLGNDALAKDRYQEALAHLDEALVLDDGYLPARATRAVILLETGRVEEAEADFQKVLAANPRHTQALVSLAGQRVTQKRYEEAVELADRAIALQGNNWYFHYVRGVAHSGLGKNELAREDLLRALEYGPPRDQKAKIEEFLKKLE